MNITGSGTINAESIKALVRICFFGKEKPVLKLTVYILTFFIFAVVGLVSGLRFGFSMHTIVLTVLSCVLGLLFAFLYFVFPKLQIKAMQKMLGATNCYTFHDSAFEVELHAQYSSGCETVRYKFLKSVIETERHLFLFMPNSTAFIVEKNSLVGNEQNALQATLKGTVPKYRCR